MNFQGWEAIVTQNKCVDVKKYLRSRSVAIKGQISVAIQRKTDLWNVEFGMVSNYEYSIQQFKIRLRSYLESISSMDRQYFVQNQENIQQLLFKLTHGDWKMFHNSTNTYHNLEELLIAIETENSRMLTLERNLHPKRQIIVNQVSYKSSRPRVENPGKNKAIDWSKHVTIVQNMIKGQEELLPCCYCSKSSISYIKDKIAVNHKGSNCYSRYPLKKYK